MTKNQEVNGQNMKLFLTSTAANVMDKIVPQLSKKPEDSLVAFIPTAGDVYDETPWIEEDREKLKNLKFKIKDLDLKEETQADIEAALSNVDIVFVAGGNTFYLLEKIKASSFDVVLKNIIDNIVYIGSSAGSVVAGPDIKPVEIFDDREAALLDNTNGLGFVDFVVLPHFGKEKYGPYHEKVVKEYGDKLKIIPLTDEQYIIADDNGFKVI